MSVLVLILCACVANGLSAEIPIAKDKLTFIDFYSDECPNCMVMQPIVDRLGIRYQNEMIVQALNIDTDGKSLFESMGLRENPVFLIIRLDGTVVYKGFGRVPELVIENAIRKAIGL